MAIKALLYIIVGPSVPWKQLFKCRLKLDN